jgi:hypothetical protein
MKRFLPLLLILLLLPMNLWAATYYLRADGSVAAADKANATSCAAAASAMNITQHNAATFAAGDTITLCDSGGVFRDAVLIPPTSGELGNVITYNASGTPVISGANIVTPGTSWTVDNNKMVSDANTVALYDFNDDATDTTANNRDLSVTGSLDYAAGVFDKYATFDGTNDYASYADDTAGDANAFDFGNNSFTVEVWTKLTTMADGATEVLVAKGSSGQVRYAIYANRVGASYVINVYGYNGTTQYNAQWTGAASMFDGNYHHIAGVFDWSGTVDSYVSLWVDGTRRAQSAATVSGTSFDNATAFTVGAYTNAGNKWSDDIEQVRVSNIARTSLQG